MANLRLRFSLGLSLLCGAAMGQEIRDFSAPVRDWSAPPYWTDASRGGERSAESPAAALASVPTSPMPFVGVKPCRIADTRSAAFPAGYGPPAMATNVSRDFTLAGQCGIPSTAQAVSLNVTVTGTQGTGYILIYPKGANAPGVSTLNYVSGQTIANAAIVPLGADGGVTVVAVVSGTQLLIDTNGYYAGSASGIMNTFLGENAGNLSATGFGNTGIGFGALSTLTLGNANTAVGDTALNHDDVGSFNTGLGVGALRNAVEHYNVAVGGFALATMTTGQFNTALGYGAGGSLTDGSYNIYIGNGGVPNETGATRIGSAGTTQAAFVAGIRDVTTGAADAVPVMIDSNGQLGTVSSSARFKEEIHDMGAASEGILELRPVTFRYRAHADAPRHFGLIAEEVEKVIPELVVHSKDGRAQAVLYHELPAMLVNELQKQRTRLAEQERMIRALEARLAALEGERPNRTADRGASADNAGPFAR